MDGDGNSSSGNGTKGGGHEGKPLCPRCGEPFTDTFSTISKFHLVSLGKVKE